MNKIYRFFLIILIATHSTIYSVNTSESTTELSTINQLIELTKQNIEIQENIRLQIIEYQKNSQEFLKKPNDQELLFMTIKSADLLYQSIKNAHLTHHFSFEFMKELKMFTKLTKNQGVPRP